MGSSEPEIRAIRHLFGPGCVGESSFVRARIPGHSVKGRKTPVVAHSDGRALLNSIDVTVPNGLHDRDWSRFTLLAQLGGSEDALSCASPLPAAGRRGSIADIVPNVLTFDYDRVVLSTGA